MKKKIKNAGSKKAARTARSVKLKWKLFVSVKARR
jgi:hypothetical protein